MKNEKFAPLPPNDNPDPFVIGLLLVLMIALFYAYFTVPSGGL